MKKSIYFTVFDFFTEKGCPSRKPRSCWPKQAFYKYTPCCMWVLHAQMSLFGSKLANLGKFQQDFRTKSLCSRKPRIINLFNRVCTHSLRHFRVCTIKIDTFWPKFVPQISEMSPKFENVPCTPKTLRRQNGFIGIAYSPNDVFWVFAQSCSISSMCFTVNACWHDLHYPFTRWREGGRSCVRVFSGGSAVDLEHSFS